MTLSAKLKEFMSKGWSWRGSSDGGASSGGAIETCSVRITASPFRTDYIHYTGVDGNNISSKSTPTAEGEYSLSVVKGTLLYVHGTGNNNAASMMYEGESSILFSDYDGNCVVRVIDDCWISVNVD